MKDLFMCLLLNIGKLGNITEASMWQDVSTIKVEGKDEYIVSVRRIKKDEEKKDA